jgi:hypothetical protein
MSRRVFRCARRVSRARQKIRRRSKPCRFKKAKAETRPDDRAALLIDQPCSRRILLSEYAESIAAKIIELAEQGDMAALRVCMDRPVPVIKHQPVAVELPPIEKPADSVEAAASIARQPTIVRPIASH